MDMTERWWQLHQDVAAEFGLLSYTLREEYVSQKRSGVPEVDIMKKVSHDEARIREYDQERVRRIELPKYLAYDTLFDDSIPALRSLRAQGHELAVVTKRRDQEAFFEELNRLGLSKYLQRAYLSGDISKQELLRKHYTPRALARSLFVSDDVADMEIAESLGMQAITAGYGCRTNEFLASHGAKIIIATFSDVLSYVND